MVCYFDYNRNMTELVRSAYLQRLKSYLSAPAVTVVTGLRRVGKSVLLRQLAGLLASESNVVYVDKESLAYDGLRTASDLLVHVEQECGGGSDGAYVIVDEVQEIEGWQPAVADLNAREGVKVVVAGSNASLLAGELATGLAGRYLSLSVFPLSLQEFADLYELTQGAVLARERLLDTYLTLGGLPGVLHTDLSDEVVLQMLRDVFNTIALRDVIARHHIRDAALFEAVTSFAFDTAGSPLSAKRIADVLRSRRRSVTVDTVLNYLRYLTDAFVLHEVPRFDIRGKRRLEVNNKYYVGDIGIRRGLLGRQAEDLSGLLENLVYLELRQRGFDVLVGNLGELEIDFLAMRGPARTYIQVAYVIESSTTLERELRPLLSAPDAYPRVLITMDALEPGRLEGVRWVNLLDFLLGGEL
mgnify:CR=1 FL=1